MFMNSVFKSNVITLKKLWNDTNLSMTIIVQKCTLLDCNILEIVYTTQTEYILKILILMKYVIYVANIISLGENLKLEIYC